MTRGARLEGMEQQSADVATFRALARSSPRMWRSVRLTLAERGVSAPKGGGWSRTWIRRPDAYRREFADGRVMAEPYQSGSSSSMGFSVATSHDDRDASPEAERLKQEALGLVADLARPDSAREDAFAVVARARQEAERRLTESPRLLEGRLLADPPTQRVEDSVPMIENYRWVALLEPRELADGDAGPVEGVLDGVDWDRLTPAEHELWWAREVRELAVAAAEVGRGDLHRWDCAPLEYREIRSVDHRGRPALEAIVRTTSAYDPRCSCCPLLAGRHALTIERDSMGEEQARAIGWPDPAEGGVEFRVRLDIGTGICVEVEALDGTDIGGGFTVTVEEIDVDYPDSLFSG